MQIKPELVISLAALVFAGISVFLNILYRKKDFYNQLLREQIAAGYHIMESLLKLNNAFTEGYKKYIGASLAKYLTEKGVHPPKDLIIIWQTELYNDLEPQYKDAFGSVLARGFIFPEKFQKELKNYFELLVDLFENRNDHDLGANLAGLYEPLANITDELNHYFKIDKLSKQLNRLL